MGIDKFYRKVVFPKMNIAGTDVSPSATELNLLDGITGLINIKQVIVDCSGGGSSESETLITLPAGSVLLNIVAQVTETFDGDNTKTFEVGSGTNEDNYIDTVDLGVTADGYQDMISGTNNDNKAVEVLSAETEIKAFWTNDDNATAGKVKVTILHI